MTIVSRSNAETIMAIMRKLLHKLKLRLNEEKSRIVMAKDGFDFLGFHFIRRYITWKGKNVTTFLPSRKAVNSFKEKGNRYPTGRIW